MKKMQLGQPVVFLTASPAATEGGQHVQATSLHTNPSWSLLQHAEEGGLQGGKGSGALASFRDSSQAAAVEPGHRISHL